jgi:hypothetical protein
MRRDDRQESAWNGASIIASFSLRVIWRAQTLCAGIRGNALIRCKFSGADRLAG